MSAAKDKVSKEAMGLVMVFLSPNKGKFNGTNNYFAWAAAMHTTLGARYGPMARVFTDQVPYVVPDIEVGELPQVGSPGVEGIGLVNLDLDSQTSSSSFHYTPWALHSDLVQ